MYTCILNKAGGIELDLTVSVLESGSGRPHSPKFEGILKDDVAMTNESFLDILTI